MIFQALIDAKLYYNKKKTKLFSFRVNFLGHTISQNGIEADEKKAEKIENWPVPTTATKVQAFLGLVHYLNAFLPKLAVQCDVLSVFTTKEAEKKFPEWLPKHQLAFETIKAIVMSRECLTSINHENMGQNKIFMMMDTSDTVSGTVLSFGPTWELAHPVAYDSMTFKGPELNYPIHEKELLAIMCALRKWKVDLLGFNFLVYMDHKTLLKFDRQKDMSRWQLHWMEELLIYDCQFVYVKGEENTMVDALSRLPYNVVKKKEIWNAEEDAAYPFSYHASDTLTIFTPKKRPVMCAVVAALTDVAPSSCFRVSIDDELLDHIKASYKDDLWCEKLQSTSKGLPNVQEKNSLWYIRDRLVVLRGSGLREIIYRLAHDNLGHFGFYKCYDNIHDSYFWPNMRKDLEEKYIPGCPDCQRNKSNTMKPVGPLHPLQVPDGRCESIAMGFIGPLPEDEGSDCILMITDRLGSDVQIIPTRMDITAEELAVVFINHWYCENGLPLEIVSNRDKLFVAKFWKALHKLTGIKLKLSTTNHPDMDGSSEHTNKTVNQSLHFHVEWNQKGWKKALPCIRFFLMNTVNKSTGYSPFQLKYGRSPRVLPYFKVTDTANKENLEAQEIVNMIQKNMSDAKDNLMLAKISQAYHMNKKRSPEIEYQVGDKVMLSTKNRHREFKEKPGDGRVAKFMPRYDGPWEVIEASVLKSS